MVVTPNPPAPTDDISWDEKLGFSMQLGAKHSKMVLTETSATVDASGAFSDLLKVSPYGPLSLDPCATALNYGQSVFEGLKAFRQVTGAIVVFRPEMNARRFAEGARALIGAGTGWLIGNGDRFQTGARPVPDQCHARCLHSPCHSPSSPPYTVHVTMSCQMHSHVGCTEVSFRMHSLDRNSREESGPMLVGKRSFDVWPVRFLLRNSGNCFPDSSGTGTSCRRRCLRARMGVGDDF